MPSSVQDSSGFLEATIEVSNGATNVGVVVVPGSQILTSPHSQTLESVKIVDDELDNEFDEFEEEVEETSDDKERYWFTQAKLQKIKIVHNYLESSKAEKYQTGLRLQKIIPSEKGKAYITKSLESNNEAQRKSAIIGSFGFLEPQFFNRTISLLNEALMTRTIKTELILLGDDGVQYYLPLLKN